MPVLHIGKFQVNIMLYCRRSQLFSWKQLLQLTGSWFSVMLHCVYLICSTLRFVIVIVNHAPSPISNKLFNFTVGHKKHCIHNSCFSTTSLMHQSLTVTAILHCIEFEPTPLPM